ncbi:type II toxin-antitoxin system Phd/YefM family antitoxin [Rhodopila sp.]|uniref:type II toxin-antitoxin system Phd/YefM family antitoxin n=1 Tax=Rhodopila sp. TaxID=2480087 RepID=UPI003D0CCAE9
MSQHSVAEAKNRLSDLIERTLAGEAVVITRHGHPVVELKALRPAARPVTPDDLEWLAAHRVQITSATNAGTVLSRIRDEEER